MHFRNDENQNSSVRHVNQLFPQQVWSIVHLKYANFGHFTLTSAIWNAPLGWYDASKKNHILLVIFLKFTWDWKWIISEISKLWVCAVCPPGRNKIKYGNGCPLLITSPCWPEPDWKNVQKDDRKTQQTNCQAVVLINFIDSPYNRQRGHGGIASVEMPFAPSRFPPLFSMNPLQAKLGRLKRICCIYRNYGRKGCIT